MSSEQRYKREPDGQRFQVGGINTVSPMDHLPQTKFPYLQNVRSYVREQMKSRSTQGVALQSYGSALTTLRRLNDTTPLGPTAGFSLIAGAGSNLYCNAASVSGGLSGKPMSLVPFRPNASVQPWMYVADSNAMLKVNANGTCYKDGIAEPQLAPNVASQNVVVNGSVLVPSTTQPWTVTGGQNPSYPFTATGGTAPVIVDCSPGSTIVVSASGTITTSYGSQNAGGLGPTSSGSPGYSVPGSVANVLMGAFTDSAGNVVTPTTGSGPVTIGAGPTTLLVPQGASQLQIGIDDTAYHAAGGSLTVSYTVTTNAVASTISILGQLTAYYWGDSPTSGPVAEYIWNSPSDPTASANPRTVSTAAGSTTNTSLEFDNPSLGNENTPMQWNTYDVNGNLTGSKPVFGSPITGSPTSNFANFNMCVVGTLYVPTAGTYTFNVDSKDGLMWGIGGGATWSGKGSIRGNAGQSITVVNKLALLPAPALSGEGDAPAINVSVTFPAPGDYPIELDYDYWYHDGRQLYVHLVGPSGNMVIPPLAPTVLQNTTYRYIYRSSATGAKSNPSPASPQNQSPVQVSTITPQFSSDPQVDKVDYFRQDDALDDFTYVGTGANTNPPTAFIDQALDADVVGNPVLEYDNFEPFPCIDQPHRGIVNVTSGIVTWVSGDQFNPRWLPGTIINVGGLPYTLLNRPSSATSLQAIDVADGANQVYEIDEPLLANQPMPSMWGPTDGAAFMFGCGDKINPGTLYFTKGNNPDSAPDTNQMNVTSPSEPLMNGAIVNGIGMVFSTERAWLLYPSFSNATATVTGTQGQPFTPVLAVADRGLYIRSALAVDGGKLVAFRAKDGIYVTSGTGGAKSITDEDLYNLFPHEKFTPQPITVAGFTIYPPDDTRPDAQQLHFANGYLYYDYQDTTGVSRTLVFDQAANGWIVDVYQYPVGIHVLEEGPGVNGTLTGCTDGSVRELASGNAETAQCVALTPCFNAGDTRADKTLGDVLLRALAATGDALVAQVYSGFFSTALTTTPTLLPASTAVRRYIIDIPTGLGQQVSDVSVKLTWKVGTGTILDLWQATWTDLPENTQDRPTDWTDSGAAGAMFWQGLILEADTFGNAKAITIEGDDGSFHVPNESPFTFSGQSKQALTFTPPFVAHAVRIIATDGVPWRYWNASWVALPFPELVAQWQSEMTALGGRGWQHIREMNVEHISTTDLTLVLAFGAEAAPKTMTLTIPNSGGIQTKTKVPVFPNKFKIVSFGITSVQPFRLFREGMECKVGAWGREDGYRDAKPFGGDSAPGASV